MVVLHTLKISPAKQHRICFDSDDLIISDAMKKRVPFLRNEEKGPCYSVSPSLFLCNFSWFSFYILVNAI